MKYLLNFISLAFVILTSCTLPQKVTKTSPSSGTNTIAVSTVDTAPKIRSIQSRLEDPISRRKTPPPLGLQNPDPTVTGRTAARALAIPSGEVRSVLENKDTQVVVTTAKNFSYNETDISIRKYVPPVTPPANKPPTSNAGPDKLITLPVTSTQLAGAGLDTDGNIASYLWSRVSGNLATISAPTAATTNVSGLVQGEYVFRLTVKDNGGLTGVDDVKVTVNPAVPPTGYLNLPASGPLDLSGRSNLIIEGMSFKNITGVAIKLYGGANNITIRNCLFDGATGVIIELENATNITVENCILANGWSGVYALGSTGIKVINNQFVNMRIRRKSDGSFNGLGNFMQFNSCSDIQVLNNKGENFPEADPEDMISFFQSSNGLVKGNIFRGNPTSTWSTSGGGIIAGDYGGRNVTLEDNTLMTPGNYGMAIAGGDNMKVLNNKIFSARNAISNNPLYVWAQQGAACSNITVTGNRVSWIDKNGSVNNGWNAGNCSNTIFQSPTSITIAEMNVPAHLIDKVTPTELLTIRQK